MSSELPWWQIAKAQSLERKVRKSAATSGATDGDSFLIVTEGTVTEPIYFELLRKDLQLAAVRIRVQPGWASHPRHVIETASNEAKEHAHRSRKGLLANTDPAKLDQVWAVIDTDVAVREGVWHEIESLARAKKVKLAYSTPCFEYWLLLHIQGFTTRSDLINGATAKRAVKQALGRDYSTNEQTARAVIPSFLHNWPQAVLHGESARVYHTAAATPKPANPCTEVCALVRALNNSAPVHLRKL